MRLFVKLAAMCLAATVVMSPSHALTRDDAQLWLARVCVHEASWSALDGANDCAAMHQVFLSLAEEMDERNPRREHTVVDAIRVYSPRFSAGTTSRAWTRWLTPLGREPHGWPRVWIARDGRVLPHPPWDAFADRWRRIYALAGGVLEQDPPGPCADRPRHWGARTGVDAERARQRIERGIWFEVDCGETRNAFYGIASRRPEDVMRD